MDDARLVYAVDGLEHLLPVHADEALVDAHPLPLQQVRQVDLPRLHDDVHQVLLLFVLRIDHLDDVLVEPLLLEEPHQLNLVAHRVEERRIGVELDRLEREDPTLGGEHPEDLRGAASTNHTQLGVGDTVHHDGLASAKGPPCRRGRRVALGCGARGLRRSIPAHGWRRERRRRRRALGARGRERRARLARARRGGSHHRRR